MNRRDFIKVTGALGVCLATPRIALGSSVSPIGVQEQEPNCVTLTIQGLHEDTRVWIGYMDTDGEPISLWEGKTIDDDLVVAEVPKKFDGRQVEVRTIHHDHLYQQLQLDAKEDATIYFQQVQDRNYVNP